MPFLKFCQSTRVEGQRVASSYADGSTFLPSALRTGRATRRCTQLASNFMSQIYSSYHSIRQGDVACGTRDKVVLLVVFVQK